jgi:hypothetical protein
MTSKEVETAKLYFEASNRSDMKSIASLMTPTTTYSSVRQGLFLGVDQIIEMQTAFHASFETLSWKVKSVDEIRPGVIYFDFVLQTKKSGEEMKEISGDEYVLVKDGKLQHVEVRNKS